MSRKSSLYGELIPANGRGEIVPIVIDNSTRASREQAGYPPERLDGVIETLIDNATSGAELLQKYTPFLDKVIHQLKEKIEAVTQPNSGEEPLVLREYVELVNIVTQSVERINRMVMQSVKAKDDASRLRSFLAGDQQRGDLENLSETQLRKLIIDAANGWQKPPNPEEQP